MVENFLILLSLLGSYNITLDYNYISQIEELKSIPITSISFGLCFGRYEDKWGLFIEDSYISLDCHTEDVDAEIGVNSLELFGFYQWNWKFMFLKAGAGLIRIDAAGRGSGEFAGCNLGGGIFDIGEFGAQGIFHITFMPFRKLWIESRISGLPPIGFIADVTYWKLAGSLSCKPFIEGQGILSRLSLSPGVSLLKIGGKSEDIPLFFKIWMVSIGIGYTY